VRDLLYLSLSKLEGIRLPPRRWPLKGDIEVSAPVGRIRLERAEREDPVENSTAKLARAVKEISRRAKSAGDPSLMGGEWFRFDQPMDYHSLGSTGIRPDTPEANALNTAIGGVGPLERFPHEMVLFYSDRPPGPALFLSGSVAHMLSGPGQDADLPRSRASAPEWIHNLLLHSELPGLPSLEDRQDELRGALAEAIHFLAFGTTARLSGLARALCMPIPWRGNVSAVVGTPLFVEFGPWNPKG
jgi:hypothetical protein